MVLTFGDYRIKYPLLRTINKKNPFFFIKAGILFLFIFLQVYLFFINTHQTLDLEVFPNTNPSPAIYYDNTVGQTFVAQRDNISRIEVMLGTYERENDKNIIFSLWALTPERKLLTEKTFSASTVRNNLFNTIDFHPVPVSINKKLYFELQSPQSTPENSICVWMNEKDIYENGTFTYNYKKAKGDLIFRVYAKRPIYKELSRIVQNYTGIFASLEFLIAAVIVFEVIQIVILIKLLEFAGYLIREKKDKTDVD
jgi:hypothetical protein